MELSSEQYTQRGDVLVYRLEIGEEGADQLLAECGIVPCHLHRNLLVDKLDEDSLKWVRHIVQELAEEMETNN
tara:strand:+ start:1164 stop:1382 length:219 start_codon:yes stop_codon:yes gene_type:complete